MVPVKVKVTPHRVSLGMWSSVSVIDTNTKTIIGTWANTTTLVPGQKQDSYDVTIIVYSLTT